MTYCLGTFGRTLGRFVATPEAIKDRRLAADVGQRLAGVFDLFYRLLRTGNQRLRITELETRPSITPDKYHYHSYTLKKKH